MSSQFQIFFVGNLFLLIIAMKLCSSKLARTNLTTQWWLSPKLIPKKLGHTPSMVELLSRQIIFFLLAFVSWWGLSFLSGTPSEYIAFPMVWFTTEWIGATFVLMSGTRGLPLIHRSPWRAQSLTDFWSSRWNIWVGSWIRFITRKTLPHHASIQLWGGFLISAVFHELMFALPFHLATGRPMYGGMSCYFLLQALGVSLERATLKHVPRWMKQVWAWSWILIPIPLFTHGPFLSLFQGVAP